MKEKENITKTHRASYLSSEDHLTLHQLKLLEWLDSKKPEDEKDLREQILSVDRAQAMPDKWQLTRGIKLYDWQNECISKWLEQKRGTIKVVTGAGKTVLALAIAEQLQNISVPELRVAIVVPTIVLMNQWVEEIADKGNLPSSAIGRLGGGYDEVFSEGRRILIAVLATACKKLPGIVDRAGIGQNLLFE